MTYKMYDGLLVIVSAGPANHRIGAQLWWQEAPVSSVGAIRDPRLHLDRRSREHIHAHLVDLPAEDEHTATAVRGEGGAHEGACGQGAAALGGARVLTHHINALNGAISKDVML